MTQLAAISGTQIAANARGAAAQLPRRAKAAIIVQFILKEGADVPLSALPEDLQVQLTQLLGEMRYIDRATMNSVIEEFMTELESVGLSFPGDIAGALSALDGKISDRTAMRLRKEAGVRQIGDPWSRIAALPLAKLQALVASESIQVVAVMVSKLDVSKAAELLSSLPGEVARRITYAMSMTDAVTPDAVDRIGLSLAAQIDAEPPKAFKAQPSERVGAILNFSRAAKRDEILTALDEEDEAFASEVRKSIFTFAHIPERMKPIDVPKLTRDLDQEVFAQIISGATSEGDNAAVEFILSNISGRMATALREAAEELGEVKPKQAEAAMGDAVRVIRDLTDSGEITLVEPESEED
ncbi:FliG C-terminal domain-containing protein [Marivita sp. GX14005]|uniref:flagellar motor switch protein FliG n=1 Tax=Marivita sp. GX14005 TaxID=2942276 RepID=UPI002018BEB9|nr:FliG C-terminal domain-containing protein [Marivita sp. GX14005]MCL3882579.1 flagellar motor switch protein FliG [Marivita sp. GX14005]